MTPEDMTVAALEEDPLREPKEEETMIGIVKEELMEDTYNTGLNINKPKI